MRWPRRSSIAAERWPVTGMPPNPGGWMTTTARNRAIDRLRRESTRTDRYVAAHRLYHPDHAGLHEPDPDRLADIRHDDHTSSTTSSTSWPTTSSG